MPTRVDVWNRQAGVVVPMFAGDAADAVKHDPERYSLTIPADTAEPSNSRPPEPDYMPKLFAGPTPMERRNEHRSSNRPPPRRGKPNRRRVSG